MKSIGKIIGWILMILCLVVVQTCVKTVFKAKRVEHQKEWVKQSTTDIDEKLEMIADGLNKNYPQQLDEITIMERVESMGNKRIKYHYTILDDDLYYTPQDIEEHRQNMIRNVKNESGLRLFKENGVTLSYEYRKQNGELIMLIDITPEDYN